MQKDNENTLEDNNKKLFEKALLFQGLYVCEILTNNYNFQPSGNGAGFTYDDVVVMWFLEPRKKDKPHSETKKSKISTFLYQDALDALLSFANIAQKTAPYIWKSNLSSTSPERINFAIDKKGVDVLVKEVKAFINRFGLVHMLAKAKGPGTCTGPIHQNKLIFSKSPQETFFKIITQLKESFKRDEKGYKYPHYIQLLKDRGLFVKDNEAATLERIRVANLSSFAKDFSSYSSYKKERKILLKKQDTFEQSAHVAIKQKKKAYKHLYNLEEKNVIRNDKKTSTKSESVSIEIRNMQNIYNQYEALEKENIDSLSRLHLDIGVLEQACEVAYEMFSDKQRQSIEENGVILADMWSMYAISLLFYDAINLYRACQGDESAFERILSKIHMEIFDIENIEPLTDDANAPLTKQTVSKCYTIWFESSGYDPDNPGSDLSKCFYTTEINDCRLKLRRQRNRLEQIENYGSGRAVYQLCRYDESTENFRDLAKKYLKVFLDGLIDEGCKCNYKNTYASSAQINPADPTIIVNDFNSDLINTLWHVMDLVNKGEIEIEVSACECCGKLIDTSKSAGHQRKYCDASCRSLHRKRIATQNKSGTENDDTKIRREFKEFMESGQAIHIGMPSHMKIDTSLNDKLNQKSFLKTLLSKLNIS